MIKILKYKVVNSFAQFSIENFVSEFFCQETIVQWNVGKYEVLAEQFNWVNQKKIGNSWNFKNVVIIKMNMPSVNKV